MDVNEAPINISFIDSAGQLQFSSGLPRVEENSPTGTIVGTIEALDYDANETLTFRLDDDSKGMFALGSSSNVQCMTLKERKVQKSHTRSTNTWLPVLVCVSVTVSLCLQGINTFCSTTLVVAGPLNYEGTEKHYVEIRVTDREGLFHAQRFSVDIVDINDVPHVRQAV